MFPPLGQHINLQRPFREIFGFREDIRENSRKNEMKKFAKRFFSVHMGPKSNIFILKNGKKSRDSVPLRCDILFLWTLVSDQSLAQEIMRFYWETNFPGFIISVYGNSCNYIFFCIIVSSLLSLSILILTSLRQDSRTRCQKIHNRN